MLTKDKTMATIQAEALAYMICATFFFDGGTPAGEDGKARRRLEASVYLLSDLLQVAANGGERG